MRPKGKLFALFAVFAAIGLVTASGAFTTVDATRTAQVGTTGDASALLALEPTDGQNGIGDGSNSASDGYAQVTNGELEINIGGFDNGDPIGSGVNYDATTDIQNVFIVTNQGTQNVNISITDDDPDGDDQYVEFYNASAADHDTDPSTEEGLESGNVTLAPGESVTVSLYVQTPGQSSITSDTLIGNNIDISATATSNASSF